jgi:hypothetical protein
VSHSKLIDAYLLGCVAGENAKSVVRVGQLQPRMNSSYNDSHLQRQMSQRRHSTSAPEKSRAKRYLKLAVAKRLHHYRNRSDVMLAIRIERADVGRAVAKRKFHPCSDRAALSHINGVAEHLRASSPSTLGSIIRGAIVDDYDAGHIRIKTCEGLGNHRGFVVSWNDDPETLVHTTRLEG